MTRTTRTACPLSLAALFVARFVGAQPIAPQAVDDERPVLRAVAAGANTTNRATTNAPAAQPTAPQATDDERPVVRVVAGAPTATNRAATNTPATQTDAGVEAASTPAPTPTPTPTPTPAPTPAPEPEATRPSLTFSGYAEFYLSYNFNAPSNGVNALRIFDSRHDHIGFNNLSFDVGWEVGPVKGHVVTQFGAIINEGFYPAGSLPRLERELLWRVLQEVTIGWSPSISARRPLTLEGGLFVAPFGVEYVQIYKNWNWSPSNLFYISPFQMTGVRASWAFNDRWTARAGLYSGWNRVVDDNNGFRSVLLQGEYAVDDDTFLSVQYQFGVERDRDAAEGQWVRHVVDVYGGVRVGPRLQLRGHMLTGLEPNRMGLSAWLGAALYARVQLMPWFFAAVRGDLLNEWVPTGTSSLFGFGKVRTLGSATVTLELIPHRNLSLRLEYRHDQSDGPIYFRDNVPVTRANPPEDIANANGQDTLCVGATAWF